METLANWENIIDIEIIENISGGNQYFEVVFLSHDKKKYKIILNDVWDMRYSIENASIDRFCEFRKRLPDGIVANGIYIVVNSEYKKYFELQVSGTRPTGELTHYLLVDVIDTVLDILTPEKLIIVPI